ncbi:MAG: hypothetical protein J6V30_01600 [Paludibacteraceae bacterium]|nr:hypothetical protein [Paludibacteraceae bacterium]
MKNKVRQESQSGIIACQRRSCFRFCLIIFFSFFYSIQIFSVNHLPDKVIVASENSSDTLISFVFPLEDYLQSLDENPFLSLPICDNSSCDRGYQVCWLIRNDSLFFQSYQPCSATSSWCDPIRLPSTKEIFSQQSDSALIFASWFSGELRLHKGEQVPCIEQVVYEEDIVFGLENGRVVIKPKRYKNVFSAKNLQPVEQNTRDVLLFLLARKLNLQELDFPPILYIDFKVKIDKNGVLTVEAFPIGVEEELGKQLNKQLQNFSNHIRYYSFARDGKKINVSFLIRTRYDQSQKYTLKRIE